MSIKSKKGKAKPKHGWNLVISFAEKKNAKFARRRIEEDFGLNGRVEADRDA